MFDQVGAVAKSPFRIQQTIALSPPKDSYCLHWQQGTHIHTPAHTYKTHTHTHTHTHTQTQHTIGAI